MRASAINKKVSARCVEKNVVECNVEGKGRVVKKECLTSDFFVSTKSLSV